MKITILGSGPSYGIPSLTRGFGDCNPANPKNTRTRSSVLIQTKKTTVLIDTSPDIKQQLWAKKVFHLDGLIYTHVHYDHCGGAEDVHKMLMDSDQVLPVYACKQDIKMLTDKFDYVFKKDKHFSMHALKMYQPFTIGDLKITPIHQTHGAGTSVGYRIGSVAYSTDVKSMTDKGWDILKGIDTWILGCPSPKENNKHVHLDMALKWIEKIAPKKAYLTHLGLHMDYDTLKKNLPRHICPAYDGLVIKDKS